MSIPSHLWRHWDATSICICRSDRRPDKVTLVIQSKNDIFCNLEACQQAAHQPIKSWEKTSLQLTVRESRLQTRVECMRQKWQRGKGVFEDSCGRCKIKADSRLGDHRSHDSKSFIPLEQSRQFTCFFLSIN